MTATPDRPNILLITTDQQRFDGLGLHAPDGPLRTPNLDSLAARGVDFRRAYSTCPVCIPARRSLLTGLHPQSHGLRAYRDGLEWDPPFTLPGLLGDAGYQTELIGKLHLFPQRKRYGFDHMIRSETCNWRPTSETQNVNDYATWLREQGVPFHPLACGVSGNGRVARPFQLDEEYHQTSWLADQVDRFFAARDPSAPFFLHASFFVPHPPLIPPQAYWDRYRDRAVPAPAIGDWVPGFADIPRGKDPAAAIGPFPPEEIADARRGYYGLIEHLDDRIGFLLDRYREYGNPRAREPLWIIFATDHGERWWYHHLFRKSLGFEASAHIPCFACPVNFDGGVRGKTSDELVSLEDLVPTALDLAGVPVPEALSAHDHDGTSLAPILRGEHATTRERLFGECGYGRMSNHFVVRGDLKYLWWPETDEEQCFDVVADPDERRDLSAEADLAPFRQALAAHLAERDDYAYDPGNCTPCGNRPPRAIWGEG